MSLIEAERILGMLGVGAVLGGFITYLLLKSFIPGYLAEKGKNLASKEDIAQITKKVESVKHEYNLLLQNTISKEMLRSSLLEKRMEAHQGAYLLAGKLVKQIEADSSTRDHLDTEYSNWYSENCLYLDAIPRESLDVIYKCFCNHTARRYNPNAPTCANDDENWERMLSAFEQLGNEFKLPQLTW